MKSLSKSRNRLAPLVFVRPTELRLAEWSEFYLDLQEWRISLQRVKMRVPHIVPLSTQAIALLRDIQPATGDGRYVFPERAASGARSLTQLTRPRRRIRASLSIVASIPGTGHGALPPRGFPS
jgi:integrase